MKRCKQKLTELIKILIIMNKILVTANRNNAVRSIILKQKYNKYVYFKKRFGSSKTYLN